MKRGVPTKIRYQIAKLSRLPSQARLAARLAGFERDGGANPARRSGHGIFFQEYIARSIHRGPFDGCWLFEERRWLGRSPCPWGCGFWPRAREGRAAPMIQKRFHHLTVQLAENRLVVILIGREHGEPGIERRVIASILPSPRLYDDLTLR